MVSKFFTISIFLNVLVYYQKGVCFGSQRFVWITSTWPQRLPAIIVVEIFPKNIAILFIARNMERWDGARGWLINIQRLAIWKSPDKWWRLDRFCWIKTAKNSRHGTISLNNLYNSGEDVATSAQPSHWFFCRWSVVFCMKINLNISTWTPNSEATNINISKTNTHTYTRDFLIKITYKRYVSIKEIISK